MCNCIISPYLGPLMDANTFGIEGRMIRASTRCTYSIASRGCLVSVKSSLFHISVSMHVQGCNLHNIECQYFQLLFLSFYNPEQRPFAPVSITYLACLIGLRQRRITPVAELIMSHELDTMPSEPPSIKPASIENVSSSDRDAIELSRLGKKQILKLRGRPDCAKSFRCL